ncbi:imine reductase family protein [Paenibacillus elgii]|uniref:imine reductase family protein n=1 Tax=Paenibacillus elgii TaxID=189691 RepID=UPI0037C71A3A
MKPSIRVRSSRQVVSETPKALKTSADSVERLVQQAWEAGVNAEFPANALPLFAKAVEAGYENEEVSAIIKVLRSGLAG